MLPISLALAALRDRHVGGLTAFRHESPAGSAEASATDGNPVVRAAIAHAQFETIHPFFDGNGRTGRALIHTVLRRGDALRNILIPISTVFAGHTDDYIGGLSAFRDQPQRLDDWIIGFCRAALMAADNAIRPRMLHWSI